MDRKIEKYSKIIFYVITVLIIVSAIYIRGVYYIKDLPFWGDDMLLAESIYEQPIWKSFTHIYGTQKAPPLFVFFSYINTMIFGFKEIILRLIPFISGCVSVIVFYILSKRVLTNKLAIISASILFCVNPVLIYYSQEFKQYSTDVLICMLVILLYRNINLGELKNNYKKAIIYAVSVFIIMITSFPSIFAILAVFTQKIREEKKFPKELILTVISIICGIIYILYLFKHIISYEITIPIWTEGFISLNPRVIYNVFKNFMEYNSLNNTFYIIMMLIGIFLFGKEKSKEGQLILIFFIYACIASIMHIYPISQRAALYLSPIFILFTVKPMEGIRNNTIITNLKNIILFGFIIINLTPIEDNHIIGFKDYNQRIAKKNDYINFLANYKEDDILIANIEFNSWLLFYNKSMGYNYEIKTIINQLGDGNSYEEFLENIKRILKKADKKKNIYIGFSFPEDRNNEKRKKDIEEIIKELKLGYKIIKCNIEYNSIIMVKRDE